MVVGEAGVQNILPAPHWNTTRTLNAHSLRVGLRVAFEVVLGAACVGTLLTIFGPLAAERPLYGVLRPLVTAHVAVVYIG
jgi:hypothetical protein